jgi:hypothetical protein
MEKFTRGSAYKLAPWVPAAIFHEEEIVMT